MEVIIRTYRPEMDNNYIYSTWTRYAYYSPKEPIALSKREFFKQKVKEINELLLKGQVKIACLKEDPYVIIGYSVTYEGEIKWICIKKKYRQQKEIEMLLKK